MTRYMSDEEHDEYEAILVECCGNPDNGGKDMGPIADRLLDALRDAEQAGRPWAAVVIDDATLVGLAKEAKEWLKRQSVVMVSHDGNIIGKATRVGRRAKREDGSQGWQQTLFRDMTWVEVDEWLSRNLSQIDSLRANVTVGHRLFELRDAAPESTGPGDAAKALGTTVEHWLESDAA